MKLRSLFLLFLITILFSCSKEAKVKLIDKNFEDEIPVKAMLSFTFNKDLMPDSLVGEWTDIEYIQFNPEVEGKFHWQNSNTLVFTPTDAFSPATNYTGKFTSEVFQYTKKLKFGGDKQFSFHTAYLDLLSSRAYWYSSEDQGESHGIKIDLEFNYQVLPSEVVGLTKVMIDKEEVKFHLITEEIDDVVSLIIADIKKEDKDYPVKIIIAQGLAPYNGVEKTEKDFEEKFEIPSPFKLEITDIQSNHDGDEGAITLYTTQKVEKENIRNYITISPSIKYKIDIEASHFTISSKNFSVDDKYELTIKKGLAGTIGGELKYDYSQPVSFGAVQPTIRFFDQKEFYVSGLGSRNIQVALINVPKVNIKITKIYENNIISYLQSNNYYYDEYYYDYNYSYNYGNPGNLGDVVYDEEVITSTLPRKGSNRILTLDFEDKLADHKGIYVLEIRSKDDYWLRASKMISISDIGLIVKKGKNSVTVFANSIKTAKALAGVTVKFIGLNNQVTHTAKTDAEGVAVYSYDELRANGFDTKLVAAQLNEDYNVLPLNRTIINTSRFDVGGKYQNPSGFEAFIYGDRNLYRPGETVNISTIVRDYKWNSPGSIPLILKFVAPNGKVFKTIKKVLNEHGSFETKIKLSSSAQTGSYWVNIFTSNNVLIGSGIIKVEEFMPDRIKVELKINKKDYKPGEKILVDIEAVNFFGPPAANRNYEVQLSTNQVNFYPKKNRDYNYYIRGTHNSFRNILRQDKTDADGKAHEEFEIPMEYRNMGMLKADIFSTVFDETGRPVNRLKKLSIYTQDVFYGVKSENYYVKTGVPVRYKLIAVDKNGKELNNIDASIELIRHEYKTVLYKTSGYFRYRSEKVEKLIQKKTIKINAKSTIFSFTPDLSGRYELRISAPGVNTYVESDIYAYGWGSTSYSSFKVNNEGQIDIELDKKKYNIGEKANVILKTPFSGKVLITIETDKVVDYFYVETDKRAASFSIDIKKEYLPNVFIGATLFKAHGESDIPLTVAHGYAALKVDDPGSKMSISITAVEKSRSNKKQIIKIKSRPNSALTIAVVDEGILQVAGYSTPDPHTFFYQKRALQVSSSNVYPYLFPEFGMIRSHTGGGADSDMAKRLNPMQSNRVKLVSFWSGIIETNSRGEAEYEIDIPQFSGDLRIMAVSYNGKVFGSDQKNMKVADPLVISVALPRFLSPGDQVNVPVILTNTTGKATKCKTVLKLTGPIKIVGQSSATVTIPANKEAEVMFRIEAKLQLGQSSINIEASALGEKFSNKTDITVRPASPLQKRNGTGWVEAGKSGTIKMNIDDFIKSSVDGHLIISKNPMIQFSKSLDYLIRYPYGCVEQTVSSAFPQIYFGDLVGEIFSDDKKLKDAVGNVQRALDRIKLMQLYNGGLTYWPGYGTESWWGSVYAAHFTVEARKAGYEVDEDFLKQLLKYLKKKLDKKETITYYYNSNKHREIVPKEVAYSLYVLALAGEKPTSLLNYYNSRSSELSLDSKYLIAGAYAQTGNIKKASAVMPKAFEGEKAVTSFGGSFYSYIRDEAIALNVLLDVDPDNQQTGELVKHISNILKTRRYLNTQERTFGFLAMGKFARAIANTNPQGTLKADGKVIGTFKDKELKVGVADIASKNVSLSVKGTGKLYYFWESEGISEDGSYLEEDKYIKVRRKLYNRNGSLISNNQFKQNDLVLVEVEITGLTSKYVENVAITDIMPACFEIENPRLTTLPPGMYYPHSRSHPQYIDMRDDRINMFCTASSYTHYYYYLVRVVSTGTYKMGPISADAMYNGEYHSYHGAATIEVKR